MEILDTAGSHHFPAMRELNIRSGRGFLLVYSVDSLQSFREAVQLFELISNLRGACPEDVSYFFYVFIRTLNFNWYVM